MMARGVYLWGQWLLLGGPILILWRDRIGDVFDEVTGLAAEFAANGIQCREPDSPGFALFQNGQIGQSDAHAFSQDSEFHFPLDE